MKDKLKLQLKLKISALKTIVEHYRSSPELPLDEEDLQNLQYIYETICRSGTSNGKKVCKN